MTYFKMKLAGYVLDITCLFDQTKEFCHDYLAPENVESDFSVSVYEDDIAAEREKSAQENITEGIPVQEYEDCYLETLALYRKIVDILLDRDVLLFHGCAVALDGKAYIFTAKSGTGKTTHTRLWLKNIEGSYVLNGDKPLLRFEGDNVFVCGTPWQGKEDYGVNEILPLGAVCILTRNDTNIIRRISSKDAFQTVMNQSYRPKSEKLVKSVILANKLCKSDLFVLGCNMEDEAAFVSYNALIKGEITQ